MSVLWPAELPFIENLNGYNEPPPSVAQISSTMEKGTTRKRNRASMPTRYLSGKTSIMTSAQYDLFVSFWQTDLAHGINPFTAKHCRTGAFEEFHVLGGEYRPEFVTLNIIRIYLDLEIRP